MAEISWVKFRTDTRNDPKIKYLKRGVSGKTNFYIFFCLITMADENGLVYLAKSKPYTNKDLAKELEVSEKSLARALSVMSELEMIQNTDKGIFIVNYSKHQNVERLKELKRKKAAERVVKYREREKEKNKKDTETIAESSNIETDDDEKNSIPSNLKTERFIKAWENWKQYYIKERHQFITPSSRYQTFSFLSSIGEDRAIEAINISIKNQWNNIHEDFNSKKTDNKKLSTEDMVNDLAARAAMQANCYM